jgi:nitrogenase molybdenum-iron protein alpha/beta subunit
MPYLISSGMLDSEIVFGGEDALRTAIRKAVSQGFSSVFVLSTCIAETIGDDVGSVCNEGWDIPVVIVPTAGFLGGSFQKGVNNALAAIAGMAIPDYGGERKGWVNIVGEKNLEYEVEENYREVERLLSLLGLKVNIRFVRQVATSDISKLGGASCNILREEGMESVGSALHSRFNIPSVSTFPAGFSGSIAFLNRAGNACGIDPRAVVAAEREKQQVVLSDFSDIAGSSIAYGPYCTDGSCPPAVREVMDLLAIQMKTGGTPVPVPFDAPVGTSGILRMLHRWRRALHA